MPDAAASNASPPAGSRWCLRARMGSDVLRHSLCRAPTPLLLLALALDGCICQHGLARQVSRLGRIVRRRRRRRRRGRAFARATTLPRPLLGPASLGLAPDRLRLHRRRCHGHRLRCAIWLASLGICACVSSVCRQCAVGKLEACVSVVFIGGTACTDHLADRWPAPLVLRDRVRAVVHTAELRQRDASGRDRGHCHRLAACVRSHTDPC